MSSPLVPMLGTPSCLFCKYTVLRSNLWHKLNGFAMFYWTTHFFVSFGVTLSLFVFLKLQLMICCDKRRRYTKWKTRNIISQKYIYLHTSIFPQETRENENKEQNYIIYHSFLHNLNTNKSRSYSLLHIFPPQP